MSTQEGQEYADSLGFKFLETSAKESKNVEEAFITMTKEIKSRAKVIDNDDGGNSGSNKPALRSIKPSALGDTKQKKKGGCGC